MKKMSEPIVFFGSGPVAAKSLELLAENFVIEAVITKPRPAHHKGNVPVLGVAERLGLSVKTAASKAELDALFAEKPFSSRVGVLVDFGIIVSQKVIDYFPLGIVNSHFSLLPEWRGADPITFAILSGQKMTGVSLMLLVPAMDEGPLLAYGEYGLDDNITTPELTEGLIELSNILLTDQLPLYVAGKTQAFPQTISDREGSYSRKLTKEDGLLDFKKPAEQLGREVRAFAEWPKSRATLGGIEVIVTKAHVSDLHGSNPGDRMILDKKPAIACSQNALVVDSLKPAGKQEMTGEAFLAGYKKQFLS